MARPRRLYEYDVVEDAVHSELLQPWIDEGWVVSEDNSYVSQELEVVEMGEEFTGHTAIRSGDRTAVALMKLLGDKAEDLTQIYVNGNLMDITREDKKIETTSLGLEPHVEVKINIPKKIKKEVKIPIKKLKTETTDELEYTPEGAVEPNRRLKLQRKHIFYIPELPPTTDPTDWPKYSGIFDTMRSIHLQDDFDYGAFSEDARGNKLTWRSLETRQNSSALDKDILFNPDPRKRKFDQAFNSKLTNWTGKKLGEFMGGEEAGEDKE
jgi:hypothetical protein